MTCSTCSCLPETRKIYVLKRLGEVVTLLSTPTTAVVSQCTEAIYISIEYICRLRLRISYNLDHPYLLYSACSTSHLIPTTTAMLSSSQKNLSLNVTPCLQARLNSPHPSIEELRFNILFHHSLESVRWSLRTPQQIHDFTRDCLV